MTGQELIDYGVSIGWLSPEKAEELKKLLEQRWIPVEERLPTSPANKVFVYADHEHLTGKVGYAHYEDYKGVKEWYDLETQEPFSKNGYHITHWMERPEPPKDGEQDG